jgi:hypothetical protein
MGDFSFSPRFSEVQCRGVCSPAVSTASNHKPLKRLAKFQRRERTSLKRGVNEREVANP